MAEGIPIRVALLVTRDLTPGRAWGEIVSHLLSQGHLIVLSRQPLDVLRFRNHHPPPEICPRDITSDEYLKIVVERSAHEKLNSFVNRNEYASIHAVLLTMLSRRDSSGTFRTIDREVVIRRLLLGLFSQMLRANPTHAIFEETPHEVADFALFEICRFMAVPTIFFQPSLVGPQLIARTEIDEIFVSPESCDRNANLEFARVAAGKISRAAVRKLERGGGTALLDRQKQIDSAAGNFRAKLRAVAWTVKSVLHGEANHLVNFTGHQSLPRIIGKAHEVFASRSLRNSLRRAIVALPNNVPPVQSRYALFALHYEPERTNMPEGLPFLSQLDAVLAVRSFLPKDVLLVVKEHYAQQSSSLRGYVGRSTLAYDYLNGIPGVEMLGVTANTRELVQGAEAIFTMTGKIGIEAAFLGTPAVYLGQPWWAQMPGAYAFSTLSALDEVSLSRPPSAAEIWKWFENQIDNDLLFGLGGTSPEKYSSRISPLPEGFEELEFHSIARAIESFLARPRSLKPE